jgi:hypothetical protein
VFCTVFCIIITYIEAATSCATAGLKMLLRLLVRGEAWRRGMATMVRPNRVNHIYDLVGFTPVVKLNRVVPTGAANVLVKLESANPGGSGMSHYKCCVRSCVCVCV